MTGAITRTSATPADILRKEAATAGTDHRHCDITMVLGGLVVGHLGQKNFAQVFPRVEGLIPRDLAREEA